jgi:hypothetical protein
MQPALELAGREKWHNIGRLPLGKASRMLQSSILIDALSSACWEKKNKDKQTGGFFLRAGHTLLAVLCKIFMAVRCT